MAKTLEKQAPVLQSVLVDCPIEDAFRLFTEGFSEWWPLALHSINGEEAASCEVEPWAGGRVFECTRSGEEHEFGRITSWDPPQRIELSWHPGTRRDDRQTVEIEFSVVADGTRVTLIHSGWDAGAVGQSVARCFAGFVSQQMLVSV